jgi:alkanesulfonate monooxygenase SsuD/methylene tetrahydromethanopterin reductase-like flavin-dependent oxidoreductase (luciferase family)
LGVALPLEHDIFVLAKQVATLDLTSQGRLQFGVGVGWNREELANHHSVSWSLRYRALAECVSALRALWVDDESEFHGEYYNFDKLWCRPKPLQQPHPPIWCGMGGKLGTQHAIAWSDGWMPLDVALGDVSRRVQRFQQKVQENGRDPIPISMVAFGDPTFETLCEYRDLGIERVILGSGRQGWEDPDGVPAFIEKYAAMIEHLQ